MRRSYTFAGLILSVGFVGFYLLASETWHSPSQERASNKLRVTANNVVSESKVSRAPAALNHDLHSTNRPSDRWVRSFEPETDDQVRRYRKFKSQRIRAIQKGRNLAEKFYLEGGQRETVDGYALLPGLTARPRVEVAADSIEEKNAVALTSSWAVYESRDFPQGQSVVYDLARDRWGVMTGMVEVVVDDPFDYEATVSGIQSKGFEVLRLKNTKSSVYVATQSKSLGEVLALSKFLAADFGSEKVRPETIFVWRTAE